MELVIFNKANTSTMRIGEKTVNITIHGGIVTFSKAITQTLNLKAGDKIVFAQAKNHSKNWFFAISKNDDSAFKLSLENKILRFRSTGLARKILASFKEPKNIRFFVSDDVQTIGDSTFYQLIPIVKSKSK